VKKITEKGANEWMLPDMFLFIEARRMEVKGCVVHVHRCALRSKILKGSRKTGKHVNGTIGYLLLFVIFIYGQNRNPYI
jgi:hypothetical protein